MTNKLWLTFLKVLLKKDFLTLWRNKGFMLAFILMPLLLMWVFVNLQNEITDSKDNFGEGSLIKSYFSYTTTKMVDIGEGYIPLRFGDQDPTTTFRSLASCMYKGDGLIKLNFTKIAIVSNDKHISGNASLYFKNYVFKVNNFPDYWDVVEFATIDELNDGVQHNDTQ